MSYYTDPVTKAELEREMTELRRELRDLERKLQDTDSSTTFWLIILFALIMLVLGAAVSNHDSHSSKVAATATKAAVSFPQAKR